MEIRELTTQNFDNVVKVFGEKIIKFDILKFKENTLNLGAFDDNALVGILKTN